MNRIVKMIALRFYQFEFLQVKVIEGFLVF
jgi:hypothetical protein